MTQSVNLVEKGVSGYSYLGPGSSFRMTAQISEKDKVMILLGTKGLNDVILGKTTWGITHENLLQNKENDVKFSYIKSRGVVKIEDKTDKKTFEITLSNLLDIWLYEKPIGFISGKDQLALTGDDEMRINRLFLAGPAGQGIPYSE
jgi:hypothetical protein